MFSQASVILFTEGGRVCMAGGMHGGGMHGRKGVCVWWGHAWQEQWPLQWTVCTLLECILVVPGRHPSWADPPRQIPHPPGRPPPPPILRDTVYKRAERILLECILIDNFLLCCILNYSRSRSHRVISRSNCKNTFSV